MLKSLLAGMAVCAVLAVSAGSGSAHVRKPVYGPHAQAFPSLMVHRPYAGSWADLRAKGGPLHDCVHVTFPQCDRGYGEPND
jgi:hypothetical protein